MSTFFLRKVWKVVNSFIIHLWKEKRKISVVDPMYHIILFWYNQNLKVCYMDIRFATISIRFLFYFHLTLKIFLFLFYTYLRFFVGTQQLQLSADPVEKTFLNLVRSYPLSEINSSITCLPFFVTAPEEINY